jgi:hypothetical protein
MAARPLLAGYVETLKAAAVDITVSEQIRFEIWKKFVLLLPYRLPVPKTSSLRFVNEPQPLHHVLVARLFQDMPGRLFSPRATFSPRERNR